MGQKKFIHTHRRSRRSGRSESWWTNHFSRRILLRFGNVALHGCGHPNSYDYCPPTLTTCLRAAADLFMDNEKLMRRVPSSTGEGPCTPTKKFLFGSKGESRSFKAAWFDNWSWLDYRIAAMLERFMGSPT